MTETISIHRQSLRGRLTRIILLTCGAAVLAACTVFAVYVIRSTRAAMLQDLDTLAQTMGTNSAAALTFEDAASAEQILGSLRAEHHVVHAALYTPNGKVLATYSRSLQISPYVPPPPGPEGAGFSAEGLVVFHSISVDETLAGIIYIESDRGVFVTQEEALAAMVGLALLCSLLVALVIAPRLQKSISEPILELARTAFNISVEKNFSTRVVPQSADEIGFLYEQFNEMLRRIEERDTELERIRDELEQRVAERTAFLSALIEASPLAIVVTDQFGAVRSINPAFERMFGYSPDDIEGARLDDMIAPGELAAEAREYTRRRIAGEQIEFVTRRRRRNGTLVDVEVHGVPLFLEGKSVGGLALYQDVTERLHAEEAIREANAKLSAVIQSSPLGIATFDKEFKIRSWNPAVAKIYGWDEQEVLGKMLWTVSPEAETELKEPLEGVLEGRAFHDVEVIRHNKDGALIHVSCSAAPLRDANGAIRGIIGMVVDISERKHAQQELASHTVRLNALVLNSTLSIAICDPQGHIENCNPAFERLFGYTSEESVGKQLDGLVAPGALGEEARRISRECLVGEVLKTTTRRQRKDGTLVDVEIHSVPLRVGEKTLGSCALYEDITERKRAEEHLRASEERIRLLMDSTAEAIYGIDLEGRCTLVNRAAIRMLGYDDAPQLLGKNMHALAHHSHADGSPYPAVECGIFKAFRDATGTHDRDEVFWRRNGTSFPIEYWSYPVWKDSQVVGAVVTFLDISERKKAERELLETNQTMTAIIEASPLAIVGLDRRANVFMWNPAAERIFGWSAAEVLDHRLPTVPASAEEMFQRLHDQVLSGQCASGMEVKALRKDGSLFDASISRAPLREASGEVRGTVDIATDISDRKRNEEALQAAKEAAEQASRAKSEFLANMSHEIRTPMNGVLGMTQLALETELTAEQREYLTMVKSSGESLLTVINDILDFSKIEAGKLEFEMSPFAIHESLGQTMKALGQSAHRKGLELAWRVAPDVPEWVTGDCGRVRQILVNLIGNAIKFTDQGEVVVGIELQEQTENAVTLHFSVRDTGPGIPSDKQKMIFSAFTQADSSTTRKYGGTGLGLTIVLRLVEAMGGTVWLDSQPGEGSVFHFTTHFTLPDKVYLPPQATDPVALRGMRTLIVDDNRTNRLILVELLKQWGMRPEDTEFPQQAVIMLDRARREGDEFGLVIMDVQMPEMDGFALAQRIKQDPLLSSAALILLSSALQSGDMERSRKAGIAAYLMKPAQPSELLDAILLAVAPSQAAHPDREATPQPAPPALHPLRVLLAEDNAVNRQLAIRLLEKRGHSVVVASDGAQALEALDREEVDLILMDVQMPEIDGLEATRIIRKKEQSTGAHVPIIALTAHAMKGDREKCLAAGADDYLSKPIQPQELYEMMERIGSAPPVAAAEPPLDTTALLERVQGDRDLLSELIQLFRGEVPDLLRELHEALENRDASALARAAHTLKGAAGNFGMGPAYRAAQQLEAAARAPDLPSASAALAALEAETERLLSALDDFLGEVVQ